VAKIKILIVEDELVIAQDISFILEDLGYDVVEMAIDYDEAVLAIKQHSPNLVLLDIDLNNDKDGVDIATYIRANTSLPFLYLTSNADVSTVIRAKETLPNGYVLKPIEKKELFASVEMALASKLNEPKKEVSDHLYVNHKDALVKVYQADILWLKAEGNYTEVRTKEQRYLIRGNIKESQTKVGEQFCRIHKSYVVNLNCIDKIMASYININEQEIPIGKMYKEEFLDKIQRL